MSTCTIFPQLTVASWFAVVKVSCFPFLNCFASFLLDIIFLPALPSRTVYSLLLHLDPREKISSPIQDLSCSRKPLTYPGSASVQCGLHRRTEYRESTKHGPLVHGPPPWTGSIDRVHGPGPSKYGQGPWTPFHGPGTWTPYTYKLRWHHMLRFDDLL